MIWCFSSFSCNTLGDLDRQSKSISNILVIIYIIKFVKFMSIYYVINLYIVLLFMIFNNLYLRYIDLLQVRINKIIFPFKKKKILIASMNTFKGWNFDTICENIFFS